MSPLDISRRDLVIGLPMAAAGAALIAGAAQATEPSFSFLAIGDWGRDGASHQQAVADQMGIAAKALDSRLVVALGDNFYPNGVESAEDPRWKTSFEDIYTAPSLQTPWPAVLGNHDYRGNVQAQIDYSAGNRRWRMPGRYYKISGAEMGAPQLDLFFLDTSPLVNDYDGAKPGGAMALNLAGQDPAAQLDWLDRELGRSTAAVKLVFGHHTIYSGSLIHGNNPELIETLVPILQRRGVRAYINGHDHDMQHIRIDKLDYVCSGAGSEVRPTGRLDGTLFAMSRSGFAVFRLSGATLQLEFRDFNGSMVYGAEVGR
ncbi:MAG: hypothetical protein JWR84_2090 [Caulobacter sp.]|nr:hypothetical protein [Caulobacter sp.]